MYDLIVIGGGPAGLAAACSAWENGLRKILVVERDEMPGGILNQCIHNGFGLKTFKEELTGPEYADRFVQKLKSTGIELTLGTTALKITINKEVHLISKTDGYRVLQAKSIILAMGCRERTRGAIAIPGTRPAGVLTAGTAQRYVNIEGYMPGKRVVILGSGDIGLIMARRMTLEGAKVLACVEVMPYSSGLNRNIVQCLNDYNIPLYLSHTVTEIKGTDRLTGVVVEKVDENRKPIPASEIFFECDTLLLSVGLIPENELTKNAGISIDRRTNGAFLFENMETLVSGIFACGNVAHVNDLVDNVTEESERAGAAAAKYVSDEINETEAITEVMCGNAIAYTVPQYVKHSRIVKNLRISFRVNKTFSKAVVKVIMGEKTVAKYKRDYLIPAEMAQITIPKKLLDLSAKSLEISVSEENND